jgi:hypothetical protein
MIRKCQLMVAAIVLPVAALASVGSLVAGAATPKVDASTLTAQCTGLSGTAKFNPPITSSTTSVTRTTGLKVKLSGCTASGGVSISSASLSGSFTRTTPGGVNGCLSGTGLIAAEGLLTIKWKTTPKLSSGNSVLAVHTELSAVTGSGGVGYTIPGAGGTPSSGTGSFQGTDGGAGDMLSLQTSLPATTILSTCESSKGLKSAVIEGPTSGDSVSLG